MKTNEILLVDDSSDIRSALREILATDFKVNVSEAKSGFEAIEMIKKQEYDVLICDVVMLNGTGLDIHSYLTEFKPELISKLIFFTGNTAGLQKTPIQFFKLIDKFNYSELFLALKEIGIEFR